ncbi:MAG: ABC transporter ATP-binding protein [Verrucomicrobia bacterium]|nr:ABC transporter ATP-binding protein [Verrucomicrobiota bacterium]
MTVQARALAYFRPHHRATAVAMLLTVLGSVFNILRPWPLAFIVDKLLPASSGGGTALTLWGYNLANFSIMTILTAVCALMVVFHLLAGGVGYLVGITTIRVGLQVVLGLRTELYAFLHSLPLKFHDQRRSSDSSFRVAYDSQKLQTIYSNWFFLFKSVIGLVGTFGTMWAFDREIALLSLLIVPFLVLCIYIYAKRIRDQSTQIAEKESVVLSVAQEGLSSIRMVQAFGREDHEVGQFKAKARSSLEASLQYNATSMKSSLLVGTIVAISSAVMFYVGAQHVMEGRLTVGQIWYLSTLLIMLYQPLEGLTYIAWTLQSASTGVQRCFEVLDRQNDVPDSPNAKDLSETQGELTFEKIAFGYTADRLILQKVSVTIERGQTVAFVGGTGAGKSTLLALVPRFYDPTAGRVLLDGHDLRDLTKKSLRNCISIVLQDTLLFSSSVRENIAYSRPDATEEEIIEAAKRAQAHEFIMAMPDGYSNLVGERGGHLSVGQRQRIGIARAFLKNAPILILDEPTSALDPTTEAAIMNTLDELMRGRTTLIITHRIATVHHMDKIVVLGEGIVLEEGKGPELVARGGRYAELYHSAHLGEKLR